MIHGRLTSLPHSVRARRLVAGAAAALVTVAVLNVATATPSFAATSPTTVSITFDNQWATQLTAAADLQAHGMAGTFYVISGWLGLPGFMSLADVQSLAAAGNEIGGKTVNNSDLPTLPNAEGLREICQGRNVLLADGFSVTDFAYPFGDVNATTETLAQQCGFNSARGVGDLNSFDPGGCRFPDCPYGESIPPADPYLIKTPDDSESNTTLAEMEGDVTAAENNGGGWLPFSFHQICDPTDAGCDPTYSFSPALFHQFLDWLQTQTANGVTVRTVQQVVGGAVQPAVVAPTVPAAPVGANALVNPTLQSADAVTPSNPECWSQESYGANTPSFSWSTTGGASGAGQETVTMSNLTSGDAKLVNTFDLGQCAPTAVAGDSYSLSAYYKSTVPVFFSVYGRSATGTWSYWTQSPRFPASSGWTLATWRTPPVPTTVQALSYGMTIDSNGTLSSSDYALVDQGPGVPPAAPIGTNALTNPLLATADGSGTNPACWSAAGFGTNAANFTWSPTGGQGGGQETINMTSWTDGDAKLVTTFDNGNCAPTVTPSDLYTLSAYYTSSVPVFFTLYGRDGATGTWGYWTQSPTFPATGTPSLATWTAPAVPANINGASFGMTIASIGTVSTSHYSLVDNGPTAPLTPQTIAFTGPGAGTVGGSASLSATGGASGNPVVFSVDTTSTTGACTVSGTNNATVAYGAVGTCVIDANQAGNATYAAATQVQQSVTVNPAPVAQTITFPALTPKTLAQTPVASATASSGLAVTFTTTTPTVCAAGGTNGATIALLAAGTCTVNANQAGNTSYQAATAVARSFTVTKAGQRITFAAVGTKLRAQSPVTVTATASSGLAVTFNTTTPKVCTASGTKIALLRSGICIVVANQAGNSVYKAAPAVSRSFFVF